MRCSGGVGGGNERQVSGEGWGPNRTEVSVAFDNLGARRGGLRILFYR